jgi:hypothetical protein
MGLIILGIGYAPGRSGKTAVTASSAAPDNPADPEAAALELIMRIPTSISDRLTDAAFVPGLTEILQDYCSVLDTEGASRVVVG